MGILNFSPIDKAFLLGSDQIKDTQAEIANLKKLLNDKGPQKVNKDKPLDNQNYMRIGPPDNTSVKFNENNNVNENFNLLNIISHPKFDDLVKNYILVKHPEWINKELNGIVNEPGYSKSTFGNRYNSTVCSDIKRYITFFIVCTILFLFLSFYLDKPKLV